MGAGMSDKPLDALSPSTDRRPPTRALLAATSSAPGHARNHVSGVCEGLPEDLMHTAVLITSELVTNAVVHPRRRRDGGLPGRVGLVCHRTHGRLLVEVSDPDPQLPEPPGERQTAEGGWGLLLVRQMAHASGAVALPGGRGKTVWFELRLSPP